MDIRKLSRIVLLLPLLLSLMNLRPAQAAGPLAVDSSKVIWCPASVTLPKARQEGCTQIYATLGDLGTYLAADEEIHADLVVRTVCP